jgi:hypothetical protein
VKPAFLLLLQLSAKPNPSNKSCCCCSPVDFSKNPSPSNCFMMLRIRPPLALAKCSGCTPCRQAGRQAGT